MEIASLVVSITQCLCGKCCSRESISEQCSYLRKPQAALKMLENKTRLLEAREADVRVKLHEENLLHGADPAAEVNLWLDNVKEMKNTLIGLEQNLQENMSCLSRCFPNYYQRVKLVNYVNKKMEEADKLIEQSNFPVGSLVNVVVERGRTLPTSGLVGVTAQKTLQSIWDQLMDPTIGIIGVYGMGGVGKTSIIKEINNKLLGENVYFDYVIWVTASKDSFMLKLQKDIAKQIGLSLSDEDDETTRASDLLKALRRRGKLLLIIDDLWEAFSLENIGVPIPTISNGCKTIISTRSLAMCHNMETTSEIEVCVLSEKEAWDLFKQKIGEEVFQLSPRICDIARQVAKECGGLPLAIITIGRALRKENNIKYWQTALSELRKATGSIEGMQNQVFARLKFSFDRLKDDTARSCFLYCALYPEDHLIETEELIRYWAWEGLLGSFGNHIAKIRLGEMMLNELKKACMLESVYQHGSSNEYVKMHDLIRDMVIVIAGEKSSFMVKAGLGLQLPPAENEWSPDLERVSLMRNDLSSLNSEPKCPKLCTLLLQYNSIMKGGICPAFFEHMQSLKVLDLSYTGVEYLPDSFSNLESLQVLVLCSCWNLVYVPTLERLSELKVLDLSYTSTLALMPEGMKMLVNLQHLELSFSNVILVPISILPDYKFLEILSLIGPWQYEAHGFDDVLAKCNNLVALDVNFSCMQDFEDYIATEHWSSLENFNFFVGYPPSSTRMGKNRVVFFGADLYENSRPILLPGRILELEIHDCRNIRYLPSLIMCRYLQRCKIKSCERIEYLIMAEWGTFPDVSFLEIEDLSMLAQLYRGIMPEGTMASLKVLHVTSCNNLKTLLSLELMVHLENLEEIKIENCENMMEIIGTRGDAVTEATHPDIVLPSLRIMQLSFLPELKHIYKGRMICDSLSNFEVVGCTELKTLSFLVGIREELVRSLKQIKGSRRWWRELKRNQRNAVKLFILKEVAEPSAVQEVAGPSVSAEDSEDEISIHSDESGNSYGPR